MRRLVSFILVALLLTGCASMQGVGAKNAAKLKNLSVGMERKDALEVMGIRTESGFYETEWFYAWSDVSNPYRTEIVRGKNNEDYEILYYYTKTDYKVRAMVTSDELTPLVIKDGILIGWGWDFYSNEVKKRPLKVASVYFGKGT